MVVFIPGGLVSHSFKVRKGQVCVSDSMENRKMFPSGQ